MADEFISKHAPVARRIEQLSGIRPVTLLVAFGIVLITGILISTGIAANHLRRQALDTTETELGRIDVILGAGTRLLFNAADGRLSEIAARLTTPTTSGAASLSDMAGSPAIDALARETLGRSPRIAAIAILAADGSVLYRTGPWPPGDIKGHDLVSSVGSIDTAIGQAVQAPGGETFIPLAHRIPGSSGIAGAVVGLIPNTEFAELFSALPLADDGAVRLVRRDGSLLTRYPAASGASISSAERANLDAVFGDPAATMIINAPDADGQLRIEAAHAIADVPVAILVSRSSELALSGWVHQGLWFGAFAFVIAIGIGAMVYLIAHQFESQQTIAAIQAEKLDVERARLVAEAELLKAERLSVLGQLTATVAHELRNPLSAIRNTLFTVKELAANGGVKLDRPISRMERSIERCDRIISDLLEYTRSRELKRADVAFDRWLGDVIGEQSLPELVKVERMLDAPGASVPIDSDRVRRVVINLIENAAQALGENPPERERRVTVGTTVLDSDIVLTIEDTGPGIPPENLARIFEPLFSTKSFGTGLGLPTVKQIITQHGGTIGVESEVGRGTTVTVRLPLNTAPAESVRVAA